MKPPPPGAGLRSRTTMSSQCAPLCAPGRRGTLGTYTPIPCATLVFRALASDQVRPVHTHRHSLVAACGTPSCLLSPKL